MKIDVIWNKNCLSFGEDDPHFGTEHEGTHAVLKVTDDGKTYYLKTSDYGYHQDLIKTFEKFKKLVPSQ